MSKQRIQLSDHFTYSRLLRSYCPASAPCCSPPSTASWTACVSPTLWARRPLRRSTSSCRCPCCWAPSALCLAPAAAHRGHHAGRGRPEKSRPLFHPVPAGGSGLGQCAGRAGHCVPAAHCRAAGRKGGAFGLRGALWTHPDGVPAHLCAAEYVPELFCHRRKAAPRLLVHRGRRLHQHGAGCADGGRLGLGRGGRCHCHLYQPAGGRRTAGVLLHRPQQLQPPAPVQDQFLQQSTAGCLHQRLFRADDQPFHVAGQYPVQLPAAASGR